LQNFEKNQRFSQKSASFLEISQKIANFCDFLQNFATFSKNQLDSFVDLEKPEKMRIWSQNFVSIQPRTSLEKSDVSWPTVGVCTGPGDSSLEGARLRAGFSQLVLELHAFLQGWP